MSARAKMRPRIEYVHRLSQHSFTTRVDVPLVGMVRVRGTTGNITLARAKWLLKNYWTERLKESPK